jgi:hypothetical protein
MFSLLAMLWLSFNVIRTQSEHHCPLNGITPPMQGGMHNFIIDKLSGVKFPFAINQCTSIDAYQTNLWHKYTCNKIGTGWAVTKTKYTNQNCTGNGTLVTTWTSHNATYDQAYECDGMNTYAKLHISLNSDCSSSVTVYAALASCTNTSTGETQFEFYCNSSVAFVEFFRDVSSINETLSTQPASTFLNTVRVNASGILDTSTSYYPTKESYGSCSSGDYCEVWIIPKGKCTLANTTAFQGSTKLYGQLMGCRANGTTISTGGSTTTTTGGAHSTSTTTSRPKSGSIRLQLAFTVVFTLFLAISWL